MSEESEFLRWRMEQVWKTRGCSCPSHLAQWYTHERGYRFYDKQERYILLWFKAGTRRTSNRGCKPKGKGFSFLPKGYVNWWLLGRKSSTE